MIYITIMIKTVIFARVSTSVQEYDRQVNELTALAMVMVGVLRLCLLKKCREQRQTMNVPNF